MKQTIPVKSLILAFIPLLVFVAADEFLSRHLPEETATRYALVLAIGLGIIQTIYTYVTEKRWDRMLLVDTGLIVLLGGISLLSGDDIFFKLKPALVQFVMVIILTIMAFMKPELLVAMSARFSPGKEIPEAQRRAMQRSTQGMVILLFLHTLLIVYAALYMSKAAWAFISGPLIFVLIFGYFIAVLIISKIRARSS